MLKVTNIIFNFLDQLAIEKVTDPNYFKLRTLEFYDVLIRVFELIILFGFFYVSLKFSQFILSLLIKVPFDYVNYLYYGFPLLLMVEAGLSKLKKNIPNLTTLIIRALVKIGMVYSLDVLFINLIRFLD